MADAMVRSVILALALVFLWAGAVKVLRFEAWKQALALYRLPPWAELTARPGMPLLEAVTAVLLVAEARLGAALCVALSVTFSFAVARARALEGDKLPCGCFGGNARRDYRVLLGRNVLIALGGVVVLVVDGDLFGGLEVPAGDELLPAALGALGVALAVWAGFTVSEMFRRGNR